MAEGVAGTLKKNLSSVQKAAQLLSSPMALDDVLEVVVRTVSKAVDADAAALRLLDRSTDELLPGATYGLSEGYIKKGPVRADDTLNKRILTGEAIVVHDMLSDDHFARYRKAIAREGLNSCLSIGLIYRNEPVGTLRLYSRQRNRRFSPSDISLAQTIAAQSAAAIVNARLYTESLAAERISRQLRLAGAVQRHLIPQGAARISGLDIASVYVPCYEVGGDIYDFLTLPDGRFMLVIGDIMGKGVPASLAMASVRSALRCYAEFVPDLAQLAGRVNQLFCHDSDTGEFATLFFCVFDPDRNAMHYCNCGHEPPIMLRADGTIEDLQCGGMILGVRADTTYHVGHVSVSDGDILAIVHRRSGRSGEFLTRCLRPPADYRRAENPCGLAGTTDRRKSPVVHAQVYRPDRTV